MSWSQQGPLDDKPLRHAQNVARYEKQVRRQARRRELERAARKGKGQRARRPGGRRDWRNAIDEAGELDTLDTAPVERVMPRGEAERRRAVERAAIRAVDGATAEDAAAEAAAGEAAAGEPAVAEARGLVLSVAGDLCDVDLGERRLLCRMRRSLAAADALYLNPLAAGDEVLVGDDGAGGGVVTAVLPRRGVLARPEVLHGHRLQLIAANVDQLLIVAAWREPNIWLELVDRYLIAAARNALPALICVNKIDLAGDPDEPAQLLAPYGALGVELLFTSARSGEGIAALAARLHGRTTVLAGLSGVGKSTLLAAVQPGLALATREVSSGKRLRGMGRHTTTQATLVRLAAGGAVVDTPGIREFGLAGLHRAELAGWFPEIAELAAECRFANCAHGDEPGCAVQAGLAGGRLAASRYHSYRTILAGLPE